MTDVKASTKGIHFGVERDGHEHHFIVSRAALERLEDADITNETQLIVVYDRHLARIHQVARAHLQDHPAEEAIVIDESMIL